MRLTLQRSKIYQTLVTTAMIEIVFQLQIFTGQMGATSRSGLMLV